VHWSNSRATSTNGALPSTFIFFNTLPLADPLTNRSTVSARGAGIGSDEM
jgi:hypothetical protein